MEGIKEKILPLSAFSGLRGVVGSEQEKFRDMPKERAEMPSCTVLLAERTGAGERRSFSEQDSTIVPKFAYRSFCPMGILLGLPPQARLFAAYAAYDYRRFCGK